MKLLIKQKFFSFFGAYDVFSEDEETIYRVEGEFALGKKLNVYSPAGELLGYIQRELFTFLPKFSIYIGNEYRGEIVKEFSLFTPSFSIDYLGWQVSGELFEWDYDVFDAAGNAVAHISKELFNFTDTYCIDVNDPQDALSVLLLVLAIDAEKESR